MSKDFIAQAEKKWLGRILKNSERHYAGHWMPSHDLEHHRRVWKNACNIRLQDTKYENTFFEELLLACFFHDLGLLYDKSDKHGGISKELCRDFLMVNQDLVEFDPAHLYEAIEMHDDKEYKVKLENNLVYHHLIIADDLDAFGALGVYRYVEIYILRGLTINEIPQLILKNAKRRLEKIKELTNSFSIRQISINERFQILEKYLQKDSFRESPLTLVQWLYEAVIIQRHNPYDYFLFGVYDTDNKRIESFLKEISSELIFSST